MNRKSREILPPALLLLLVFISMMVLFVEMQPLILFDTDDWQYISIQRSAFPAPFSWNPTRLLPELVMPLFGNVAAYLIMPFAGDYVESLTIAAALAVSTFVVAYVGMFYALVRKKFRLDVANAILVSTLFYLLHFIALRGGANLFQSFGNVTNLFYYALPNLMCCSVVLYLMRCDLLDGFFSNQHVVKKGILLAALYFALLSNLYASIVVAAYVGIDLLARLVKVLRERSSIAIFAKRSIPKILVLAFWLMVQILEVTGGRSHSVGGARLSLDALESTWQQLSSLAISYVFVGIVACSVIGFVAAFAVRREKAIPAANARLIIVAAVAGLLTLSYLILLCSSTYAVYIVRTDVICSFMFYVIVVGMLCLACLIRLCPRVGLVVPLAILIVFFSTHPAVGPQVSGCSVDERAAITNSIIAQVREGAAEGNDEVEVRVPDFGSSDNWPVATYAAQSFSQSLFRHGLIDHPVTIKMVVDPGLNEKFGVPLREEAEASSE